MSSWSPGWAASRLARRVGERGQRNHLTSWRQFGARLAHSHEFRLNSAESARCFVGARTGAPITDRTSGVTSGTYAVPATSDHVGGNVWYRVYLWVRDVGGWVVTTMRDVLPRAAVLNVGARQSLQVTAAGMTDRYAQDEYLRLFQPTSFA